MTKKPSKKRNKAMPTHLATHWLYPGLSLLMPLPSVEEINSDKQASFADKSLAPKTMDLSLEELNKRPTIHSDEDGSIVFG